MGTVLSSVEGTLLVGVLIVGLYTAYRAALPKPLANIPYNRDAARRLLGDVPEMVAYVVRTKRVFCWLTSLTRRHQSPIIQAFIKPMSLPWVVVTDPFESQDILLRRTKEFDRSGFFGELIGGILPEQHIQFLSSDARFKNNRNLINHLMAPTFITQVSGPQAYKAASTLIRLWELKCTMAEGRPFAAHADITYMALDTIFAAMFGHPESESIMIRRLQAVSAQRDKGEMKTPGSTDQPVLFSDAELPEVFAAALTLANSVMHTQLSPLPRLTSWVLRQLPYMKKATAIKDKYIRDKVDESARLMEGGKDSDATHGPRTALHSVLLRERDVATKEGRRPDYHKRAIADEFFGFMLAGHDTSATTLAWGVKFLADHPAAQDRLRAELRAALPEAAAAAARGGKHHAGPSYSELARAHIPYLDAVVEEVLRHANTIAFVVRVALQDTTVLGRHIPKGTDVFLMANGAGYLEPSLPVADETRSPGARRRGEEAKSRGLTGAWDDGDIGAFRPERWLRKDKDKDDGGAEVFDPMAGPSLAFGLGPRGCFGRRFALHALKIQFALIVWHFHLLPVPPELGGYDAVQKFAREPTRCYVRLRSANI
ncbi:0243be2b-e7fd-4f83-ac15-8e8c075fc98c [Thermothielavioides terrestris]|uniref:0243be2b-e7fd-4f83-ac15-8e8c075fc98c n=1 Tax=Thermothielavioides terrestris TaxID=2587410 RepID=A0A3S4ALK2_9PEZI|nr:0243be2b-e7fd-4f83-ac15-8e8c075fc98c [Thermothielavioides terrestris]